jgi:hypothetical protein
VKLAPVNVVAPSISGAPAVGQTLTCATGTWNHRPNFTYQWYTNTPDTAISGATASTFLLTSAQLDKQVFCRLVATNSTGFTALDTAATLPVSSGTWTPLDDPGTIWYLDAANSGSITKDGADRVSAWANLAPPNIGDMVQGTGALQPLWLASGINGYPAVEFVDTAMIASFLHTTNAATIVYVGTLINGGASGATGITFATTGSAGNIANGWMASTRNGVTTGVRTTYVALNYTNHTVGYATPYLRSVAHDAANGYSGLNGAALTTTPGAHLTDYDFVALGANITSGGLLSASYKHQRIGVIVMFSSLVASHIRQRAEGYLAWRFGLTLDAAHPYFAAPP